MEIIALSGGKDSTALALRLKEVEPGEYEYLITPTGDELPEMVAHWQRLEVLLGKPLTRVTGKADLSGLIREFGALPNWRQRWCTRRLKIEPCLAYLATLTKGAVQASDPALLSAVYASTIYYCRHCGPGPKPTLSEKIGGPCSTCQRPVKRRVDLLAPYMPTLIVGLRADEEERKGLFSENVTTRFPLREWGWGIKEVQGYLAERGVVIPKRTDCARCYGQRIDEWWTLWRDYPAIYADAERQEADIGHTFRSPGRDTWPAALSDLRAAFENGRTPRRSLAVVSDEQPKACRVCSL